MLLVINVTNSNGNTEISMEITISLNQLTDQSQVKFTINITVKYTCRRARPTA